MGEEGYLEGGWLEQLLVEFFEACGPSSDEILLLGCQKYCNKCVSNM